MSILLIYTISLKNISAKSIAHFFFNTPKLSKEKLGEYFGEEHEINIKVSQF